MRQCKILKITFSYIEFDEIAPLIADAVVKIVNFKQRKHPKNREYQKLFWSYGHQNWTDDELKERLRISRYFFKNFFSWCFLRAFFSMVIKKYLLDQLEFRKTTSFPDFQFLFSTLKLAYLINTDK